MSETKGSSWPKPKKIDRYYERFIDLQKKKIEKLQAENEKLKKKLAQWEAYG